MSTFPKAATQGCGPFLEQETRRWLKHSEKVQKAGAAEVCTLAQHVSAFPWWSQRWFGVTGTAGRGLGHHHPGDEW